MRRVNIKYIVALIFVLSCFSTQATATTVKKEKKLKDYGRIEVKTTPMPYRLLIDGEDQGLTSTSDPARAIDIAVGRHVVEVIFSPTKRFTQEVNVLRGKRHCFCLNYAKNVITRPCPTSLSVSAPSTVNDGDVITFASDIAYGGTSALNYIWTVSPASARIVSGAGTPTITVDTTGVGNQSISAILVVDDGSGIPQCRQTAQAVTAVTMIVPPPVVPRPFDEFPNLAFDDQKARLDNLAIELANVPGSTGYIIVYSGRTSRAGQADRLGARARDYMVRTRGVDPSRITVVNGGYREEDTFEIWIVPQGAQPPQATPTLQPSDAQPGAGPRTAPRRRRARIRRDDE
ncbi:MAG TPA: hypothetical protein VGX92_00070 [Pyrinomonadaceae bacterium]|jgi:hypothetical protein|nr:hypothetical protein [Pyrinomonadaceae bacterium]